MKECIFIAEENAKRADLFISQKCENLSRTECAKLLEDEKILINDLPASKKQNICLGDIIHIIGWEFESVDMVPENIPIDIIYQDEDIVVVNKAQGMVVHPAHGNYSGTLVHAILYHIKDLSGINGIMRPGIVHRLDKNTSGLIIIAKNDKAHISLAEQFKNRTCTKIYLALAEGVFKQTEFVVENYIGRSKNDRKKMAVYKNENEGRYSNTEFKVLEQFKDSALVECKLNTGRTHQIRVHLASVGHPCVGDGEYGFKKNRFNLDGQMLHSYKLEIIHPTSGEKMSFIAPMPEYMEKLIKKLQFG